jgi:hypothetical protein
MRSKLNPTQSFNHPLRSRLWQTSATLFVILIIALILYDASGFKGIKKYQAVSLEDTSIYSKISEKENGWLIEYPIAQQFPECNYAYYYHQHVHKKPIVNCPYKSYEWFRQKYEELSEKKLEHMHLAGVRYICVTKGLLRFFQKPISPETLGVLANTKFYKEIENNGRQIIYEADVTPNFGSIDIREFVYDRPNIVISFIKGWSGEEPNRIWSTAKSAQIKLNSKKDTNCKISFSFDSISSRDVTVNYSGSNITATHLPSPSVQELTIKLLKGDNYLNFITDKEPLLPGNGDPRKLSFALLNYRFEDCILE